MTSNNQKRSVKIVAHRGASGQAPENTLASIKAAISAGADCIEVDVHLSRDGYLVLLHDETLQRTTNGRGKVYDFTYAELEKLDAGSWFAKKFAGESIPALKDVLHLTRNQIELNIEIKADRPGNQIGRQLATLLEQEKAIERCIVTSFDQALISNVKSMNPNIRTGFIFKKADSTVFSGLWEILSCKHRFVDKRFITQARATGKEIHVWTVNSRRQMRRLYKLGVDAIITDYPDRLKRLVDEISTASRL
ncbi:glycerophosphodiester phosphodiesterase [candidate division KSB1 bacterium]|nr:glycerophosphodiester phosphodiesterase [candidate division KSB1 bacterium]